MRLNFASSKNLLILIFFYVFFIYLNLFVTTVIIIKLDNGLVNVVLLIVSFLHPDI